MEWVTMPRHRLAGSETQTAHHRGSSMKQDFVLHSATEISTGAPRQNVTQTRSAPCVSCRTKKMLLGKLQLEPFEACWCLSAAGWCSACEPLSLLSRSL